MTTSTTARLERETEATRAEVERTLDELRTRMSPGQLLDQAADYMRNGSGRAFLGNLRHQVVDNPLPVTLIGAGIAWLAISGAIARRGNGHRYSSRGDWGDTAATAEDLAHGGREAGYRPRHARDAAADLGEQARATAEGWASKARETAEGAAERARDTAEDWIDETRDTLSETGDRLRDTAEEAQQRAAGLYDKTIGRARQAAWDASRYAGTARRRVAHSGDALLDFCREQPMLVAGIGLALGAVLGAMLPGTRAEARVMGDASRDVRERAGNLAERAKEVGSELYDEAKERATEELESGLKQAANATSSAPDIGKTGMVDPTQRRGGTREAAQREPGREPPSSAPYAEAAEAGAASEDAGQRT